jgi:hypothetical protein
MCRSQVRANTRPWAIRRCRDGRGSLSGIPTFVFEPETYTRLPQAVKVPSPWKLRLTAQSRSILGGCFHRIRPTCNQRLAAPSGETFLGGTRKALELAMPCPAEHAAAATRRRPRRRAPAPRFMPASAPANEAETPKTNCTSFADWQRGKGGSSSLSLWTTREEKPEGTIFVVPVKLEEVEVPKCRAQWQWARQTVEMRA